MKDEPRGPRQAGLSRRHFARSLPVALAGLAFSDAKALAASAADLAPEIAAIKSRGHLTVGMTSFDSAPFYYLPNGQPQAPVKGWDVQLANDLARVLEVQLLIDRQANTFDNVVDRVVTGAVDVAISKLSMTPARAVMVRFTQPTIQLRHALLANRVALAKRIGDGDVRTVINRHFDGTLGVIARSSYAEIAKQVFTKAGIREFPTWEDVVGAVENGTVELAYRDELEVKKLMRLRPELHLTLRSVLITDYKDSIAVAVPSRSYQLLSVLNVILAQRRQYDANQLLDTYADVFKSA